MNNKIYITDENGAEVEMNVYFTFDYESKNYCLLYETGKEDEIFPFTYDDDGNLYIVEDEEEMEMIQEVLDTYNQDLADDEKEEKE